MNKKSIMKMLLTVVLSSMLVCTPAVATSTGLKNNPSDGEDEQLTVKQQIEQQIWQEIYKRESINLEEGAKFIKYIQTNASEEDYAFVSNMYASDSIVIISVPSVKSREKIGKLVQTYNEKNNVVVGTMYIIGKYNLAQLKNIQKDILNSDAVHAHTKIDLRVELQDDIIYINTYAKDTQIEEWIKNYKNNDCIIYYYNVESGEVPADYKNNPM